MTPRSLRKAALWLGQPRQVYALWLGRPCVLVAWLGLFAALAVPPHGLGWTVCWFQAATGIPCPGCGLTRSLSCGLHGHFLESWSYHPMGPLILALFVFTAGQSLLPALLRDRLARAMQGRAACWTALYLSFVVLFLAFGIARAARLLLLRALA